VNDGTAPDRLPRKAYATALAGLGDPELVVEVQQVLLDRGLRDDERCGDLADGGWFLEDVAVQRRAAARREHVPLAASQIGWSCVHVGHR
jgi:hypothetical protein